MIISEEQVRRAVEYLQTPECQTQAAVRFGHASEITPELLAKVRSSLEETPDLRDDRVAQGKELLANGDLESSDVAEKMIGRIISDSIR